jgi:hypothetical protein
MRAIRTGRALWFATSGGTAVLGGIAVLITLPILVILAFDALVFSTTGLLIVQRQPGNRVGWLLLAAGLAIVVTFSGFALGAVLYLERGATDPLAMLFGWLGSMSFYPTFMFFGLIGLLFPDGRLPSAHWRPIVGVTIAVTTVSVLIVAVVPGAVGTDLANNPFGIDSPLVAAAAGPAMGAATVGTFGIVALGAIAVASRFRRARGETRQQLKWFLAAVAAFAALLPLSFVDTAFMAAAGGWTVFDLLSGGGLALLPLAITAAVLRYRLYDIDRLISATLAWAAATSVVGAVFVIGVVASQALLASVTQGDVISVVGSTLIAAALFQPIRTRIQTTVDRRFHRARVDAEETVDGFVTRLRHQVDLEAIQGDTLQVVANAVAPKGAALWIKTRGNAR